MSKKYFLELNEEELATIAASFLLTAAEMTGRKDEPFASLAKAFLIVNSKNTVKISNKINKLLKDSETETEQEKEEGEEAKKLAEVLMGMVDDYE